MYEGICLLENMKPQLLCLLLVKTGMDVETRLGFEWTPLMCAVSVANYDLAKLLLDRGASANFSKGQIRVNHLVVKLQIQKLGKQMCSVFH